MNKEQASEAYIKAKLRDSNEYLGCEESRRMTLIQSDMYTVQQAFEDGWKESSKTIINKACNWLLKGGYFVNNTETINDFKKAMEE